MQTSDNTFETHFNQAMGAIDLLIKTQRERIMPGDFTLAKLIQQTDSNTVLRLADALRDSLRSVKELNEKLVMAERVFQKTRLMIRTLHCHLVDEARAVRDDRTAHNLRILADSIKPLTR